ncbi:hypothetical protein PIROE2DRAFT_11471 [Piromyces sp. E2]|nr:hypothetical protein PIROE2DRAFT_11471 [Piromyces sp. E2]|eukprot:OUM62274.1 hypothetical protein PIROE2DRAFT_11471 [Piromyces sp. E2]
MTTTVIYAAAQLNTYESLGIDSVQKKIFLEKTASDLVIPVINISTLNNNKNITSSVEYIDCVVDVLGADGKLQINEKSAKVKVRGNSSAYFGDEEKANTKLVPYRIKFTEKSNILGLHNGEQFKNWVLLKQDWDVIRNDIALRMGRAIFKGDAYVSDSTIVTVYVNDIYKGIYILTEQNQVNEKRVNVKIPEKNYNGTDIGYYFEIDSYHEKEKNVFKMNYEYATVADILGEERQFVEHGYTIKSDIYSPDQIDFIAKYTRNVFKIIYLAVEKNQYMTFDENYNLVNSTFINAEETIGAVFDLEAAVDMYLLYEIVHDYDVGWGSFFFAVDFSKDSKIPKLQMNSPWDFNWAYVDSFERYWAGTFSEKSFIEEHGYDRSNPWFIELAKTTWFQTLASKKWEMVSSDVKKQIDEETEFAINSESDLLKQSNQNVMKDINTLLSWITSRISWMDRTFIIPENIQHYSSNNDIQPFENVKGITVSPDQDDLEEAISVSVDGGKEMNDSSNEE